MRQEIKNVKEQTGRDLGLYIATSIVFIPVVITLIFYCKDLGTIYNTIFIVAACISILLMWVFVGFLSFRVSLAIDNFCAYSERKYDEARCSPAADLMPAIRRVEKRTKELDDYCRQVVASIRVHESFVEGMDIKDWNDLLDQSSWSICVNTKIRNQLIRSDIWTIRQLVSLSVDELMDKTGMGEIAVQKLRRALHAKCKYLHLELLYAETDSPIHKCPDDDDVGLFDPEAFIQNNLEEEVEK